MAPRRRMLWLYRPTAPSVRAQSVQVIQTAHASASRGHQVTLCVQAATGGVAAVEVLDFYGLEPIPTLDLHVLPAGNTAASIGFRAVVGAWLARGGGVVIARSKRYAAELLAWGPQRFQLVVEAHEVDSLQAEERGEDGASLRALEARVLGAAVGVVANCEGTAELLRTAHPGAPRIAVLHNASHPSRVRHPAGVGEGIGYAGSLLATKNPEVLADLGRLLRVPVTVLGPDRRPELGLRSEGWLRFEPQIPHREVPDRLARFAVLALPVGAGLFGERLTSPLKLWDYLGAGRPIVASDTAALRAAGGDALAWSPVGDAAAMARQVERLLADPDRGRTLVQLARARFRTWAGRAEELDTFLDEVLA